MRLRQLAATSALLALACVALNGCDVDKPKQLDSGAVVVTITLSRSGAVGPVFDQVPQPNIAVSVIHEPGNNWAPGVALQRHKTDTRGEARFTLPPGNYEVDTDYCPDGPQKVSVAPGATSQVKFDCLAP